jgi:DNA-binding NarL/FixJ family response regulator
MHSGNKAAVVVDDQPLWRDALSNLVTEFGLDVVGAVSSVAEGVALINKWAPTVVITQFGDGVDERAAVELIVAARNAYVDVRCIVVCNCDQRQIEKAFAAGATAVLRRTAPAIDFATALRQVFERSIYFARPQATGCSSRRSRAGLSCRRVESEAAHEARVANATSRRRGTLERRCRQEALGD